MESSGPESSEAHQTGGDRPPSGPNAGYAVRKYTEQKRALTKNEWGGWLMKSLRLGLAGANLYLVYKLLQFLYDLSG